jgi:aspartyl/asparaginyl-tRNA synthetase|tara:strand:+ start:190 stop:1032 length:843 start_codon:yes stop_codon:yes gene_type:complete
MEGIDYKNFDIAVNKLRAFFRDVKGFKEVHTQNKLSILAACEDPTTIATYNYDGRKWPMPQTGQMWLEHYLLEHPEENGFFCVSTSYRNEPNPVPGRHDKIFPMFEFELKGGMDELRALEKELLEYLGFRKNEKGEYPGDDYDKVAEKYGVKELEHEHETKLDEDYGSVFFLENFPEHTSPFWNMRLQENGTHSNKIDVIIHGMETIGSAERSTSPKEMKEKFETISEGGYAGILYDQFGKERVQNELDEFLKYDFFQRSGGGIGMTRMIRAMKLSNILV